MSSNGADGFLSQKDIDELLNESNTEEIKNNTNQNSDVKKENENFESSKRKTSNEKTINLKKNQQKKSKISTNSALDNKENLELLLDVKMNMTVEIGRTKMKVQDVLKLGSGAIVELDKLNGESVDIMVHGKLIGRGQVIAVDETFGVQLVELIDPEERLKIEL